ncbi:hypothetical protein LDC_1335 [sediment metagenome]|uniref:Uncharacterized protein n=1 Tax=sediment metagenome TaxID=749907 RepID=D9PIH7_9ZZZZ
MSGDFDINDIAGDSNAGAYRKQEVRSGPPLDYVSEKMEIALVDLHHAIHRLQRLVLDSDTGDIAVSSAMSAFRHELVAFCALHNMLGLANDPQLVKRLLVLSPGEFEDWLTATRSEGSVTG